MAETEKNYTAGNEANPTYSRDSTPKPVRSSMAMREVYLDLAKRIAADPKSNISEDDALIWVMMEYGI